MKHFFMLIAVASTFLSLNLKAEDLDVITKNHKIRIAVDATYPPMEFQSDDGKIIGLDIDLAKAISKELKVEADFIVMPWDGILAGLQSNRYDIIMSTMNITDERKLQVNFVPYLRMGQVFIIKKGAKFIYTEKDLAQKIIAVQADTTSFTAVEEFKKSGIAIKEIKAFKSAQDAFSALKSNQAEVIVIDEAVGLYYAALDKKSFQVSGQAIKPEPIGIAVRKSDLNLFKALENAVKKIKSDGSLTKVYKQWLNRDPIQ